MSTSETWPVHPQEHDSPSGSPADDTKDQEEDGSEYQVEPESQAVPASPTSHPQSHSQPHSQSPDRISYPKQVEYAYDSHGTGYGLDTLAAAADANSLSHLAHMQDQVHSQAHEHHQQVHTQAEGSGSGSSVPAGDTAEYEDPYAALDQPFGIAQAFGVGVNGMGFAAGMGLGVGAGGRGGFFGADEEAGGLGRGQGNVGNGGGHHGHHPHHHSQHPHHHQDQQDYRSLSHHSHSDYPVDRHSAMGASGSAEDEPQLDEHGNPILGGANASLLDDKQRKRIMQACEACRTRKAKCNGLQPCGRCSTRKLVCSYAHERKMRGPNKVKKTAEMKAQQRAERLARNQAKQSMASHAHAMSLGAVGQVGIGGGLGTEDDEARRTREIVAMAVDAAQNGGAIDMTLDNAGGRYDVIPDPEGQGRNRKSASTQDWRRAGFMAPYANETFMRDSYDRAEGGGGEVGEMNQPGQVGGEYAYAAPGTTGSVHYGSDYYSSFSRSDHTGKQPAHLQVQGSAVPHPTETHGDDSRERAGRGGPTSSTRFDHGVTDQVESPGRNVGQGTSALAAYLLPDGATEGSGEFSPGATGEVTGSASW